MFVTGNNATNCLNLAAILVQPIIESLFIVKTAHIMIQYHSLKNSSPALAAISRASIALSCLIPLDLSGWATAENGPEIDPINCRSILPI